MQLTYNQHTVLLTCMQIHSLSRQELGPCSVRTSTELLMVMHSCMINYNGFILAV